MIEQIFKWLGQLSCALWTHHSYIAVCEGNDWFLHCHNCGKRTTGWRLDAKPPVPIHNHTEQLSLFED